MSTKGKRGFPLVVNLFIVGLIALNSMAIILYSVPEVREHPALATLFIDFEIFSVLIFTIEYGLRVWSCIENPNYKHPFGAGSNSFFRPGRWWIYWQYSLFI